MGFLKRLIQHMKSNARGMAGAPGFTPPTPSGVPSGAAGGDLTGTYPNPTANPAGNIALLNAVNTFTYGGLQAIFTFGLRSGEAFGANVATQIYGGFIDNGALAKISWTSGNYYDARDTGLARASAGVLEINNGTAGGGAAGKLNGLTVATLPGTPAIGMYAVVTDALVPVIGNTVAAGGAAKAFVWYNGANWTVMGK